MLDPLTAVSLASSVVQLADFGIKLVTSGITLYYSVEGFDAEKSDLDFRTTHLQKLTARVVVPTGHDGQSTSTSEDEKELVDLAKRCRNIATELLAVLDGLRVKKPAGTSRKWESFRKAVAAQTPWNKDRVASLEKNLLSARQAVFERISFMMSEKQSQVFLTIKDLADTKLFQMRNRILKTVDDAKKQNEVAIANLATQLTELAEASRDQKILCILNSLDFDTRQARESDIADTESRTFAWIFDDYHGTRDLRVGLRKWLQSGDDIYWISGKPGSGKSVMMNYIANDPTTEKLLRMWAGATGIIIAKYFFWNAGAPMQKSQQGLLQSLLHEIYGQCPDLIPTVCPRWERYYEIGATWSRRELSEAFKRLRQMASLKVKFCFFIDGVDEYEGEDHADIVDLLTELNASPSVKICLSSRPWNIFIAAFGADVSRRLLLEDHNALDIRTYVTNKLEMDDRFAALQSRDSRSSVLVDKIVRNAQGVFLWVRIVVGNLLRGMDNDDSFSDLQRRLDSFPTTLTGYFQHMFDNHDEFYRQETAEILLICLEGLQPLSLLVLWFHEQERLSHDDTPESDDNISRQIDVAAVFHKIHKRINARGQDLLTIEENHEENHDYAEHLAYTVRFTHRTVKDFLLRPEMTVKLKSWCSKDFVALITLCKATLAIMKSTSVLRCSALTDAEKGIDKYHIGGRYPDDLLWCWEIIESFFKYSRRIGENAAFINGTLVDECEHVVLLLLKMEQNKRPPSYPASDLLQAQGWMHQKEVQTPHPSMLEYIFQFNQTLPNFFLTLALEANLKFYINYKLSTKSYLVRQGFLGRPPLDRALRPRRPSLPLLSWIAGIDPGMVRLLLKHGADPNQELTVCDSRSIYDPRSIFTVDYAWTTVWALFLKDLYDAKIDRVRKSPSLFRDEIETAKILIENGAAADIRPWRLRPLEEPLAGRPKLTPAGVLFQVFPKSDAVLLDQLIQQHRPWFSRRMCSCLRRTILLWFYRDIQITVWLLQTIYTILFNGFLGVIFPMVLIPVCSYWLWLAAPFISHMLSLVAPVLLPALILSDWVPVWDILDSCGNFCTWLKNLILNGYRKEHQD